MLLITIGWQVVMFVIEVKMTLDQYCTVCSRSWCCCQDLCRYNEWCTVSCWMYYLLLSGSFQSHIEYL